MGASVKEIDRSYGHLARDSEDTIRARLEARAGHSGVSGVERRERRGWLSPHPRWPCGGAGNGSDGTRTHDLRRDSGVSDRQGMVRISVKAARVGIVRLRIMGQPGSCAIRKIRVFGVPAAPVTG
jgi:hypothetical protein